MTQQNAAMVEQSTAAGYLLKADAVKLTEVVAGFKIQGGSKVSLSPSAKKPAAPEPVTQDYLDWGDAPQSQTSTTAASGEGKWQDF
ncbi:hypothetical protein [Pseudophaeobacter leonis]|uniref:hypothetical protein n=1 Tax=Pseudophaeobacter leonis TaxID=1144477 RepID=UPI003B98563E